MEFSALLKNELVMIELVLQGSLVTLASVEK